jgi:plastocyanin
MVAAIALILTLAPGVDRAQAQDSASVDIADFAFGPNTVTITAGGTVTWTNSDSAPHTATGDGGSFDTGTIDTGGIASISFDTPGTYTYFCAIHPEMTGTVVVVAADGGDDGGDDGTVDDDDDVTGLPDTGSGITAAGQSGELGALGGLALMLGLGALALRRRTA